MLLVVFYGCETWSLILRDEHRLGVFKNRVLRRKFVPKREEVVGGWRRLRNKELQIQVKEAESGGACSTHGSDEKFIQNFSQKT